MNYEEKRKELAERILFLTAEKEEEENEMQ